ncbi:hypothetical protein [Burkholderia guangdongensis]|uniref:hypothetical protein n=1 Tax=Burkholderia guangdongensis TaxID=1792500 RepID=UPI0015C8DBC4|nr:hypothetical protein [Burkholderia guangdongensis]
MNSIVDSRKFALKSIESLKISNYHGFARLFYVVAELEPVAVAWRAAIWRYRIRGISDTGPGA